MWHTSTASCMWSVLWWYIQKFIIKIKIARRKKRGKNSSKQHILQSAWAIPAQFLLRNESFGYNFRRMFMNLYCKVWIYTNTDWMWHMHMQSHNSTISSVSIWRVTLLFLVFVVQVFAVFIRNVHPSSFLHAIHCNATKTLTVPWKQSPHEHKKNLQQYCNNNFTVRPVTDTELAF
jgi:hypothetical protein